MKYFINILAIVFATQPVVRGQTRVDAIAQCVLAAQVQPGGIGNARRDCKADRAFLTSYNLGGLALVRAHELTGNPAYAAACRRFIEFWMARQNRTPDRSGVAGTIYDQDYIRDGDRVEAHVYDKTSPPNAGGPGYDAADADPPIVAVTAARYARATHDLDLLKSHADGWDLIEQAMTTMLDADGLTWAHPRYRIKYLMDAVEVQAGFRALADIWHALGDETKAARNRQLADRVARGIDSLWSGKSGCYDWNRDEARHQPQCDWSVIYPDGTAQLWPALWAAGDAATPHAIAAWSAFAKHWPRWPREDGLLSWPEAAVVASRGDATDRANAREQIERILRERLNDDRWEVNQMYSTLLAIEGEADGRER